MNSALPCKNARAPPQPAREFLLQIFLQKQQTASPSP